jgi:hypothetical protein
MGRGKGVGRIQWEFTDEWPAENNPPCHFLNFSFFFFLFRNSKKRLTNTKLTNQRSQRCDRESLKIKFSVAARNWSDFRLPAPIFEWPGPTIRFGGSRRAKVSSSPHRFALSLDQGTSLVACLLQAQQPCI